MCVCVCVCVCVPVGEFDINWHIQYMRIFTYKLAILLVCKLLYFVSRVVLLGTIGCALDFLGYIGSGLMLWLIFGCMSPVDMICKYVCLCVFSVSTLASSL